MTHASPSSNIPGEATPCLFSGALDGDQDSLVRADILLIYIYASLIIYFNKLFIQNEVSVSGCRNEDEISVTIVSR